MADMAAGHPTFFGGPYLELSVVVPSVSLVIICKNIYFMYVISLWIDFIDPYK